MAHRQLVMVPSGDDTAPRDLRVSTPSTTLRLDVDRTLAPDYKPMTAFATPSLDRGDPWGAERAGTSVRARVQLDRDNPWTGRPFD